MIWRRSFGGIQAFGGRAKISQLIGGDALGAEGKGAKGLLLELLKPPKRCGPDGHVRIELLTRLIRDKRVDVLE